MPPAWWFKERQKGLEKCNDGIHNGGFRPQQSDKGASKDFHQNKGRGEEAKKEPILIPDSQPQKYLMKKDMAWPDWSASHWTDDSWNPDAGRFCTRTYTARMVAAPFNLVNHPTHVVLDLGCTRSIGSRAAIERFKKHAWYHGITTEFCRCDKSFVSANSETETCKESCIIHFSTAPPCSTKVDVLETGDVPILFSLAQIENLGTTIELDPTGDKITCPAFGLYSSPAEHSTMGHSVLDLKNLAYQPTTKLREQSGHPKRHVTFAMSERRPAYPAHGPDTDEDNDEDDQPLVRPASRKELGKEKE